VAVPKGEVVALEAGTPNGVRLGIVALIIWIAMVSWPAMVTLLKGHRILGFFLPSLLFFLLGPILA
jgi:hypothetical protein